MKNQLIMGFNILFLITFFYMIYQVIFHNNGQVWQYSITITIVCTLLYVGFLIGIYKWLSKKEENSKNNIILLFAMMIFFQIIIGTIFQVKPAWDVKDLFFAAEQILTGNAINLDYFYQYENNLGMEIVLLIIFQLADFTKLISHYNLSMYINIILIDLAVWITYLCAKKLYGPQKATIVLLFLMCMTPIYLYVPIIYTDTFTMFIPILLYYLYLKANEKIEVKYKYYFIMSILLAVGVILKPTVAIIMIAIVIMNIIDYEPKKILGFILSILIASILVALFYFFIPSKIFKNWDQNQYEEKRLPVYHWIMMGLEGEGCYNVTDYINISKINGYQNKKEYALEEIKNRLGKIKSDGIGQFLTRKITYVWGEGTYFAQTTLKIQPIRKGIMHEYVIETGEKKEIFQYFSQAQHLTMLIMIMFCAINSKDKNKNILKVTIFGVFLFFLIWETRSRYLINYLPIMSLLVIEGIESILKVVQKTKTVIKGHEKIIDNKK